MPRTVNDPMEEYNGGSPQADHLCVLVHGLWGNPNHMANLAKSLRTQYPADQLHILCAKRNSGNLTHDGIELGGERVCLEIEEELQVIESRGGKIKKLSVVGYSLGGLVARYAIGLLYAKGILDDLECMNFTAFASPFLGIRAPLRGSLNSVWNVLGARLLGMSGRQLFGIDKFRDTGRPLIAVLADPNSIFMSGLKRFKRHTLYSNIVNDRSAVYYTTFISKTDPYKDLSKVKCKFVKGYDDVVLDPVDPVSFVPSIPQESFVAASVKWIKNIPYLLALAVFLPIGMTAFVINSGIQTIRSSQRIRLHEKGLAGIDIANYRVPLWIKEIREAVEDAYENINSSQDQEYLTLSEDEGVSGEALDANNEGPVALGRKQSHSQNPTLALAPGQFEMIKSLDSLGWRKYPVWIHKVRHSHAAIIMRMDREGFAEGKTVLRHWLAEEFLI